MGRYGKRFSSPKRHANPPLLLRCVEVLHLLKLATVQLLTLFQLEGRCSSPALNTPGPYATDTRKELRRGRDHRRNRGLRCCCWECICRTFAAAQRTAGLASCSAYMQLEQALLRSPLQRSSCFRRDGLSNENVGSAQTNHKS